MKIAYKSSPVKLRAKTPSRYDLKYDNVSKLCFKHTNVIFFYMYMWEKEWKCMCVCVCVWKQSVIAIKRARKEEKQRRRRKKERKGQKKARGHIWCALRRSLMYSDTCNVQYILRTTRACIENYKHASDQSPVIFYVISLFLISVSIFLDLYES